MINNEELWRTNKSRIDAPRSRFNRSFTHKTTFNAADIIPHGWEEVYPGDTCKMDFSFVVRMLTPINPVMDNAYLEIHAFFVPMRIIWEHSEQFFGQNDSTFWTQTNTYTIPQADSGVEGQGCYELPVGSIGDYMGLPVETSRDSIASSNYGFYVSELPLRAYYMIYNDWYRDENTTAPALFLKGDSPNASSTISYADSPKKAARYHSYFGSALPAPQKGTPASISDTWLPVLTRQQYTDSDATSGVGYVGLAWRSGNQTLTPTNLGTFLHPTTGSTEARDYIDFSGASLQANNVNPANLWAYAAGAFNIESIRKAAVIQHVFESLARGGSRYIEFVKAIFNVSASDSRLDRPEYLGGERFPIVMKEVLSNTDNVSSDGVPLGFTGAMSKTGGANQHIFSKSFTEHGILIFNTVIRHEDTFFQGIEKKWRKKEFFDFHMPQMSYLGEQPVMKSEIMWPKTAGSYTSLAARTKDTDVFGYQEYGAELRYAVNRLSGYMRPDVDDALSTWTYAEILPDDVALNSSFMEADATGIDRTIAIPSTSRPAIQFFGDFKFDCTWVRELPTRSIPGLRYI